MDQEFLAGHMMEEPLLTTGVLWHAREAHGPIEIVSRSASGAIERSNWDTVARRAGRLAKALVAAGIKVGRGTRVATLAWNSARHLELYYAVPGIGAVLHTVNPRLFVDQLLYIFNHAEDDWVFVDPHLLPLAKTLFERGLKGPRWVVLGRRDEVPSDLPFAWVAYEDLIAPQSDDFDWPELSERQASILCYTSGTTGEPRGVLYSHRSTVLHAMALMARDAQNLSARDTVLPVVPMFHANAWGLPYLSAMVGTKLVLPGPHLDGASLFDLMEKEGVTVAVGIPTVWWGLLNEIRLRGKKPSALKRLFVGGASCPPGLGEGFMEGWGIEMVQGWGMTETSPVGTMSWPRHDTQDASGERNFKRQGRPLFGVRLQVREGARQDGAQSGGVLGELHIRGHWVIRQYFKDPTPILKDGWFPTGDVVRRDAEGSIEIVDRVKDMIRSGGEWISSIALEQSILKYPGIREAAAIAIPDPKWGERPLMVLVTDGGLSLDPEDLKVHMRQDLAPWQIPEAFVFVSELPKTATGKISKKTLRADFEAGRLLP